ncbi:hypothetical protein WT22_24370 [Burkholderia territorii]|nr:hypothetical protein WT22_24370 [Burkholderia territorii]KWA37807.1 hypothetical protein WT40_08760 [Burkholderia territorii]
MHRANRSRRGVFGSSSRCRNPLRAIIVCAAVVPGSRTSFPSTDNTRRSSIGTRPPTIVMHTSAAFAEHVARYTGRCIEATSIRVRDDGDSLIYFSRAFHRVSRTACVR